jgi:hypothetical protein
MDTIRSDAFTSTSSRRGFVRKLGVFAAAGLGVALLPSKASAINSYCCPSNQLSCQSGYNCTGSTPFAYWCSDGCVNRSCCICLGYITHDCWEQACTCSGALPNGASPAHVSSVAHAQIKSEQ